MGVTVDSPIPIPPTSKLKLTARCQRFVDEYLIDLNATQAAIRAGYSAKSAYSLGSRLLKTANVQAVLSARQRQRSESCALSEQWVLDKLRENANHAMTERTYDGAVANRALELIGKHCGMFVDRSERKLSGQLEVRVRIVREGRRVTAA